MEEEEEGGRNRSEEREKKKKKDDEVISTWAFFFLLLFALLLSLACGIKQVLKMRLTPFLNRTPTLFSTCRVSENLKSVFPIVWSIENE